MPKNNSLKVLLDHAQQQTDASAKKLGQLNAKKLEAEQKLQLLLKYRQEYQANFQNTAKGGVDQMHWRNFNAFISKLDHAIKEQQLAVAHSASESEAGGEAFRTQQRKLDSYQILSKRHQAIADQQQKKQEQKEQDEYSSNKVARNPSSPK